MQQSTNHSLSFPREAIPLPIHHFPIINKGALPQALALTTAHSSLQILNDLAGWRARPTEKLSDTQTWLPIRYTWGCRLKSCHRLWAELQVCAFKAKLDSSPCCLPRKVSECHLGRLYGEGQNRELRGSRGSSDRGREFKSCCRVCPPTYSAALPVRP